MKTAEIVLYQDERQGSGQITVEQMLNKSSRKRHAGHRKMLRLLANPEEAPSVLTHRPVDGQCVALLFCGKVIEHENGNKYVMALRRKSPARLVAEKYWLADPLLPTFYMALHS